MPKRRRRIDPQRWQDEHRNKTIVLSDRMYTMALALEAMSSRVIDRETVDTLMGGTLNGFIARGYIRQHSETSVYWTAEGSRAVRNHGQANIYRKPSGRFSQYLSLATFDDRPRKKNSEAA